MTIHQINSEVLKNTLRCLKDTKGPKDSYKGDPIFIQIEYFNVGKFPELTLQGRGEVSLSTKIQEGWYKGLEVINYVDNDISQGAGRKSIDFFEGEAPNNPLIYYSPVNQCKNEKFYVKLTEWDTIKTKTFSVSQTVLQNIKDLNIPFIKQYEDIVNLFEKGLQKAKEAAEAWNKSKYSKKRYFGKGHGFSLESKSVGFPQRGSRSGFKINIEFTAKDGTILKKDNKDLKTDIDLGAFKSTQKIEDQILLIIADSGKIKELGDTGLKDHKKYRNYEIEKIDDTTNNIEVSIKRIHKKDSTLDSTVKYHFNENCILVSGDSNKDMLKCPYVVIRMHGNEKALSFPGNGSNECRLFFNYAGRIKKIKESLSKGIFPGLKDIDNVFNLDKDSTLDDTTYDLNKAKDVISEIVPLFQVIKSLLEGDDFKNRFEKEVLEIWLDLSIKYKNIKTRISSKSKDLLDKLEKENPDQIIVLEFLLKNIPHDFQIQIAQEEFAKITLLT